jgi:hypothetical protein
LSGVGGGAPVGASPEWKHNKIKQEENKKKNWKGERRRDSSYNNTKLQRRLFLKAGQVKSSEYYPRSIAGSAHVVCCVP